MEFAVDRSGAVPAQKHRGSARSPWQGMSDGELLVAIAEDSRDAFEELHGRYHRALLGLAINRLRDRGRAEDAVQEMFTSVWRSAATYRPERGPGAAWMYAVARNAIISRWRKRVEAAAEPSDEPSREPGPAELAEQAWRSFCVHRALETLPGQQRQLVELAYWGSSRRARSPSGSSFRSARSRREHGPR